MNGFPRTADIFSVGTLIADFVSFLDQTAAFCIDTRNGERPAERRADRRGGCAGLRGLCCRCCRGGKCEKKAQKESEQASADSFVHERPPD